MWQAVRARRSQAAEAWGVSCRQRLRAAFAGWKQALAGQRLRRSAELHRLDTQVAGPKGVRVRLKHYWRLWRRYVSGVQTERAVAAQKQHTWQKVDQWLTQIRSVSTSGLLVCCLLPLHPARWCGSS